MAKQWFHASNLGNFAEELATEERHRERSIEAEEGLNGFVATEQMDDFPGG